MSMFCKECNAQITKEKNDNEDEYLVNFDNIIVCEGEEVTIDTGDIPRVFKNKVFGIKAGDWFCSEKCLLTYIKKNIVVRR